MLYDAIRCYTMQNDAMRCNTMQSDELPYTLGRKHYKAIQNSKIKHTSRYNIEQHNSITYIWIQCYTVQHDALQFNTTQRSTTQHDAMRCKPLQYMQYDTMRGSTIQYDTIKYNAKQYKTMKY